MQKPKNDKSIQLFCLTAAMLWGLSGCGKTVLSPGPDTVPSAKAETNLPVSSTPQEDAAQPTLWETTPTESIPEATGHKNQPEQDIVPSPDSPPQLEAIQSDSVIDLTVAALTDQLPQLHYNTSHSGGTEVKLSVSPGQTDDEMAASLLKDICKMFGDTSDTAPEQSGSYIYNIIYNGATEDGTKHSFSLHYIIEGHNLVTPTLDTGEVAAQVTQKILGSSVVQMVQFDGSDYTEKVIFNEVPLFYNTQQAIDYLSGAVEAEIEDRNLLETVYTEFKFVYDTKDDTSYVFLLYLK